MQSPHQAQTVLHSATAQNVRLSYYLQRDIAHNASSYT